MWCSLNLTAVMGCPWRQAVHRAQISLSSFCFFFWKERTKRKLRHDVFAWLAMYIYAFYYQEKRKKHKPWQSSPTRVTYQCMLTPTHSQRCVTHCVTMTHKWFCCTFFTCTNLLFHKDEAEFHFRILAIFQQNYLRHEDLFTFHSFNIPFIKYLIKVH